MIPRMTWAQLAWSTVPLVALALAWGARVYDAYADKRAVSTAILRELPKSSGARVIDLSVNGLAVCGWLSEGRGRPALPFVSLRTRHDIEVLPLAARRTTGSAIERAQAAKIAQIIHRYCGSALPPEPPGAFADPATDRAVDRLGRFGVDWVVVRPIGADEYVVLGQPKSEGPVAFATIEEAQVWISDRRKDALAKTAPFRRCYEMRPSVAQDACLRDARLTEARSATS